MNAILMRLTVAILALGLTFTAEAAVRYWLLQGVMFDDGTSVSGSFAYDDVADVPTTWNLRVQGGANFLPYTYLPGNTPIAYTDAGFFSSLPTIIFRSPEGGDGFSPRELRITPVTALDGSPGTVAIDVATAGGGSGSLECYNCGGARLIVAGTLQHVMLPPPVALVPVIEFYHAAFDHYFMSADPIEINALDTGYFTGWARTGYQFYAYVTGSSAGGSIRPVCRYYGLPSAGIDSHFYSASGAECFQVNQFYGTEWQIESDNVFQIALPDTTTGACPGGTVPVYRVFNNRHDANHRYMTSTVVRAQMEAAGWIREGYGPNATIMCAEGV
ncbi:hypothetical protein BURK1_00386 [Burkholderiales bacterium]|nr:hypothetical protein BURK1_00386 [Burkholderiales bacterium]